MKRIILAAIIGLTLATAPAVAETVTGLPIVVDGDSLRFPGVEVRVYGIDAPELHQTCTRDGKPWACGKDAKAAMRALINGRPVTCVGVPQVHGSKLSEYDGFGRLLSKCRAGDTDLNAAMVEAGMAVAFRRYSLDYVPQENAAREARRGMWQGEFVMPWDYRAAKRGGK